MAGAKPERRGVLLPFRRGSDAAAEMSDEALLAACAVGEAAALGALFDRHNEAIFRFVSRTAFGPASDVEDLVQCTFIEVWKSAARYRVQGSARGWIFGIAANLARHYVRSEVRRRKAMESLSERPAARVGRPDDKTQHKQMVQRLALALEELSYDQRVAFVLCDLEELSGVDVARALGIREGTLWRRLHDARKNLRAKMQEGGPA